MTSVIPDFDYMEDEVESTYLITAIKPIQNILFQTHAPIIGSITATDKEPPPLANVRQSLSNIPFPSTRARRGSPGTNVPFIQTFIIPILVAIAFTNNAAVLGVALGSTPFKRAIFLSVRLLYIALAIADLLAVLFYQTVDWLDGTLHLGIQTASNASCRLTKWTAFTSEMSSQWLLVWLCLTRIASITWPLELKSVISPRVTASAIAGAIIFAIATSSFTLWTFSITKNNCKAFAASGGAEESSGLLQLALLGGTQYVVSTFILLVLSLVLAGRLLGISRQRRVLRESFRSQNSGQSAPGGEDRVKKHEVVSRELRMAVTILMMAALHLCVHVIGAGLWVMLYIEATSGLSPHVRRSLRRITSVVDTASILIRMWNFWAYFATIPTFRAAVLFGVTFGQCRSSEISAQRPTSDSMATLERLNNTSKSPEKSYSQL